MEMISSFGFDWISGEGDCSDVVLSTRVRLARNLQGFRFGVDHAGKDREAVLERVRLGIREYSSLEECTFLDLNRVNRLQLRILLERRLVSTELIGEEEKGPSKGTGVMLGPRDCLSVMVNEEDHLRIQAIISGLELNRALWGFLKLRK